MQRFWYMVWSRSYGPQTAEQHLAIHNMISCSEKPQKLKFRIYHVFTSDTQVWRNPFVSVIQIILTRISQEFTSGSEIRVSGISTTNWYHVHFTLLLIPRGGVGYDKYDSVFGKRVLRGRPYCSLRTLTDGRYQVHYLPRFAVDKEFSPWLSHCWHHPGNK